MPESFRTLRPSWGVSAGLVCLLLICGCSSGDAPETAEVSGTVKLDGKPLEGATITFTPESGRPSSGVTNAEGYYELRYTNEIDGAMIGTHRVSITTARDQSGGEGDQPLVEARKELLPPIYNTSTQLTEEVKPGDNTIDFDLQTVKSA